MAHVQGGDCFCLRYLLSDESWRIELTQKAMEMDFCVVFCAWKGKSLWQCLDEKRLHHRPPYGSGRLAHFLGQWLVPSIIIQYYTIEPRTKVIFPPKIYKLTILTQYEQSNDIDIFPENYIIMNVNIFKNDHILLLTVCASLEAMISRLFPQDACETDGL